MFLLGNINTAVNSQILNKQTVVLDQDFFSVNSKGINKNYDRKNFWINNLSSINQFKRGAVEIRRIFNEDKFIIRFWRTFPLSINHIIYKKKNPFSLSINNLVVEQTEFNTQEYILLENSFSKYYEWFDGYFDKDDDDKSKKSVAVSGVGLQVMTITSDYLKMTFENLKSVVATFNCKYPNKTNEIHFWEVKKEKNHSNKIKNINLNDIELNVKTPEFYKFYFDEFGDTKKEVKYFNTNIKFNTLNQLTKISELATINSYSDNLKDTDPFLNNKDYFNSFNKEDKKEITNKIRKTSYEMFKNQSLSFLGIKHIYNKNFELINNELNNEIKESIYTGKNDVRTVHYDWNTKYDYSKKMLIDSQTDIDKGLIIPYNFSGEFTMTYDFIHELDSKNKKNELLINITQNISKPLLDPYKGLFSLKHETNMNNERKKYNFSIDYNRLGELITNKMNSIDEMVIRYKNEFKN
ncbi:MHO_1580 family protein [Mycoplasma tauri]|uniref:MHO_1580 family protein n=1 Tax=Mycoplasma tauri TaxID=547987 RepID=UPI00358E7AAC